jgi:hypothetical protein
MQLQEKTAQRTVVLLVLAQQTRPNPTSDTPTSTMAIIICWATALTAFAIHESIIVIVDQGVPRHALLAAAVEPVIVIIRIIVIIVIIQHLAVSPGRAS